MGEALGALALALVDRKYISDPLNWAPEFEKAVKGLWDALPQSDRQQLSQEYRDACKVWTWCVECGAMPRHGIAHRSPVKAECPA